MILTTLLAAAGLCAGLTPAQNRSATSEDTAEGGEILRRILVDTLDDAFEPKEDGGSTTKIEQLDRLGVVTTLWTNRETVQHSRVFHLPDVGFFFALDAALPVVSREPASAEPERSDKARDDEWEAARRELRGGSGGETGLPLLRNRKRTETEIDPKAISQVVDLVLKTVGRHAARIEGMAPQESITVALRLSGRGRTLWNGSGLGAWDDEGGEGEAHVWSTDADELAQGLYGFVLAGGSAREQNLVIRISLADAAGFGEGGLERLRQRAQVNRY